MPKSNLDGLKFVARQLIIYPTMKDLTLYHNDLKTTTILSHQFASEDNLPIK